MLMQTLKVVNTRNLLIFLSLTEAALAPAPASAKNNHLLIFRAEVLDGSRAHKKLLKSGLRFRRLKKTKLVFIEETDQLLATDFRADAEFAFIEEDRQWRPTDFGVRSESPETDAWVPDFFEDTTASPASAGDAPTQGVVLGIVDSGLRLEHPYFSGMLARNTNEAVGSAGVDDDNNGYVDDVYGANTFSRTMSVNTPHSEHGTHVASLAALSIKVSHQSTASSVRLLPINFMSNGEFGSTSSALLGLEYAVSRGAKVVNVSWGGAGIESYSQALYEAFTELYRNDVLVVAAAGNESNDNDQRPFFPANYNLPNLISVASITPQYGYSNSFLGSGLSFFSNFGVASVDVAAPGDMNYGGTSIGVLGANGGADFSSVPYVRMMGTSMAAPVVSGVAAVVRSLNRNLSASETKQILISSSVPSSGGLMELNLGAGVVAPMAAYQMAINTQARSTNPALPQDPVRGNGDESRLNVQRSGGCGLVRNVAAGGPPEGPMGGNSVLLLSGIYLLSQAFRRRKSLLRSPRNCV